MAPPTLHLLHPPDRIAARVVEMAAAIEAQRGDDAAPLHVVGVLMGAWVFVADLVRAFRRPVTVDFLRARSYGTAATSSGRVRIDGGEDVHLEGRDVLLVEDIVDTGHTIRRVVDHLGARGAASVTVAALLDKPSRREVDVEVHHVGFEVPDAFVVGYGLDLNDGFRSLPGLWTVA
jgi:hypoxanthine phosphoribosyltransferase